MLHALIQIQGISFGSIACVPSVKAFQCSIVKGGYKERTRQAPEWIRMDSALCQGEADRDSLNLCAHLSLIELAQRPLDLRDRLRISKE